MPQKLILVRGLPGSGKSTFAENLVKSRVCDVHYETDMYFVGADDEYKFNPHKIHKAHLWCRRTTRYSLLEASNVVVSNTFTQHWEMKPYFDMAKEMGVETIVYTMKTQYENVHGVPEATIERMRKRWEPYEGEIFITGEEGE